MVCQLSPGSSARSGAEYPPYSLLLLPLTRYLPAPTRLGSEVLWARNLGLNAAKVIDCVAVVGGVEDGCHFPALSLGLRSNDRTLWNDVKFYLGLAFGGLLWGRRARVVHHVNPFGFRAGMNPFFLFPKLGKKLVIGPLLTPQSADEPDALVKMGFMKKQQRYPKVLLLLISFLSSLTLRRSDAVIYASERAKMAYEAQYPFLRGKKVMILNSGGYDSTGYPFRLRSRGDRLVVGVASNLIRRKNVDKLLLALGKLKDESLEVRLGGDGPERPMLKRLSDELGISGKVRFVGRLPSSAMPSFYLALDVYVALDQEAPTEEKPSLQEAAMTGCPFISGEPISRGMARRVKGGFEVNPQDVETLASVLKRLMTESGLIEELSAEARSYAIENFSADSVQARLKNFYSSLDTRMRS